MYGGYYGEQHKRENTCCCTGDVFIKQLCRTNIRELSASLGLVKSGVYKHYESKEAIWNALLDQMIAY